MSTSWRDKAKKKFKKPAESFFDFADEETTFNQAEAAPEPAIDAAATQPAPVIATAVDKKPLSRRLHPEDDLQKAILRADVPSEPKTLARSSSATSVNVKPQVEPKLIQPSHESPSEPDRNLGQISDDSRTNLVQTNFDGQNLDKQGDIVKRNLGQSSDKPRTEPRTNLGRSSDNPRTAKEVKPRTNNESSDKPRTEPRTKSEVNLGQSSDKPRTVSSLQALAGLQQKIAYFFYELCCEKGGKVTGPISIDYLVSNLSSTRLSIQKTIQRLEQKKILERVESKSGRGGWTVYEIPNEIWNEFRQTENIAKLRTNLGHSSDNSKTQPRTEPRTNVPSKLVSDLNNNLLTSELTSPVDNSRLLELESVSKFGITQKHIQDIRNQKIEISFLDFQNFITRFSIYASDSKNVRAVKSFPALFISMVQSLARGEDPLTGIETPEEQLISKLLSERKAIVEKRKNEEQELEKFEFETWLKALSEEKRLSLVPETNVVRKNTHAHTVLLREYFRGEVWPTLKTDLLTNSKISDLNL